MASIRREVLIEAPAEDVWAAVRDVGAPHERLAPGFVVATRRPFRNVTTLRRLVWAVVGSPRLTHHNASMQV